MKLAPFVVLGAVVQCLIPLLAIIILHGVLLLPELFRYRLRS